MRLQTTLAAFAFLLLAFVPVAAYMQAAQLPAELQYTYEVNIDQIMDSYGLGDNERIVKINTGSTITMHTPLVIMGSGADVLEKQGFNIFTSVNPIDPQLVLEEDVRSFYGHSIENFDMIVIGGPDHNAYTKELLGRGIITCSTTDVKMPGLVIERARTPSGHTVLVIGDVAGYPYHRKDLPLNGIIPEKFASPASVAAGASLGLLGVLASKSSLFSSIWDKLLKFASGYFTTHASEMASEKEAEARRIKVGIHKKAVLLGYSAREIAAAVGSAALFGVAFVIADRLALLPLNIALYILTGGLVLATHDLGHRLVAYLLKVNSEFQFWGLGTVVMLLTSWLFGLAFAQPGRFLIEKEHMQARKLALVTLAGPTISLALSIAFLPLILFGGLIGQIGLLGFTMNMVTVVYNLMPFSPMDGRTIYEWSKLLWALLFVPTTAFFVAMTFFAL